MFSFRQIKTQPNDDLHNLSVVSDSQEQRRATLAELRQRCAARAPQKPRFSTELPVLDRALGGGLPRGQLVEAVGQTGRLSLSLWLLAVATRRKETVALIDGADALDPTSAAEQGIDLQKMIWVRAQKGLVALRTAELVLGCTGLSLVVVYLVCVEKNAHLTSPTTWSRLSLRLQRTGTSMLVVSEQPLAQSFAAATLAMGRQNCRWQATPGGRSRLLAQSTRIEVVRSRLGAPGDVQPFHLAK